MVSIGWYLGCLKGSLGGAGNLFGLLGGWRTQQFKEQAWPEQPLEEDIGHNGPQSLPCSGKDAQLGVCLGLLTQSVQLKCHGARSPKPCHT